MLGYGLAGTLFVVGLVLLAIGFIFSVPAGVVTVGWILLVAALVVFLVDAARGGRRGSRL